MSKRKLYILIATIAYLAVIGFMIFTHPVYYELTGSQDLTKRPNGTYCYTLKVENEDAQAYAVPAEIGKFEGHYTLYKWFWPNGGYVDTDTPVEIEKPAHVEDENWVRWTVTLLNSKAEHQDIPDQPDFDWTNIIINLLLATVFYTVLYVALMKFFRSEYREDDDIG